MREDVVGALERYVENHPGATVMEVLANADADPAAYRDVVEQLLAGDEPVAAEDTNTKTEDRVDRCGPDPLPEPRPDVHAGAGHHRDPAWSNWAEADFTDPDPGIWPGELLEREQWMGHVEKKPFAPWGDTAAPAECNKDGHETAATCDCDARWKWGYTEHYVDGETIAMAEVDPRLDGRAFLQQEADPYVYVDGDDVRCQKTGEVHPAFVAILEHFGLTYADISQSDKGVHAQYKGDLPDDVKQAAWRLDDEPWGVNDDLPSIEIYDGKRVCVATGQHVPGTPDEVREWNDDALEGLLEANDQLPKTRNRDSSDFSIDRDDYDLEDYEPTATSTNETSSDIRDLFAAVDRLDAQRVAERTIVQRWNDDASTSGGERAFWPTWGSLSDGGTANIVNDKRWQDTGTLDGYGGPVTMAAIDAGEIRPANARPVDGETWWRGIERLRELGFDIPEYEPEDGDHARPVSALPLEQLDALEPAERRRYAQQRGLGWPTTDEARDRLFDTVAEVMRNEDDRVIDAPTALGKSHTIATTRWGARRELTGDRPVIHLSATRDARDEAVDAASEEGGDFFVLRSRDEACPVAAGDHDPHPKETDDRQVITIDGVPASDWLRAMCEGRGVPFSAAHRYLEGNNDQGAGLPCCSGETHYDEEDGDFEETPSVCPAISQWETLREGDHPLVIATHPFAHVPGLRMHTNIVFDEEPDFVQDDLSQDRIRRAVTAYLKEVGAEIRTFEKLLQVSDEGLSPNEHDPRDFGDRWEDLYEDLNIEPDSEWYFENEHAHTLAPALARAILGAEERGNGRRAATVPHEPPRLDANARDDDSWNRSWVSIVLDEDNTIQNVRVAPDLGLARSVIGLDAHPSMPIWWRNTLPHIKPKKVLDPEERQLWRRYERGLRVVQVGDATRPLSSGQYFNERQVRVLLDHLREEYGTLFTTAITASSVEAKVEELMTDVGIHEPRTMHFGEEKSRNDFANERIGLVNGCIDPGDDYVLDLLAELDLEAEPETSVDGEGNEHRARGRGFVGPDADVAGEILASVRENHTAQAAGRYARNADDSDSTATVFVRTNAIPTGFADVKVGGVEWVYSDLQEAIVDELRSTRRSRTATSIADSVDCSKEHVRQTLTRLGERGVIDVVEKGGENGATLYADSGLPNSGVCDFQEIANGPVWGSYTYSLAVRDPTAQNDVSVGGVGPAEAGQTRVWNWRSPPDPGD